jgi:hypothetical protein
MEGQVPLMEVRDANKLRQLEEENRKIEARGGRTDPGQPGIEGLQG